jgi:formylglycine-generating enzyme required for sulfatase activity
MARLEGGAYGIGSDAGRAGNRPRHVVNLRPFLIDAHEVTNGEFAEFLNSLEARPQRDAAAGALTLNDIVGRDAGRVIGGPVATGRTYIELDDDDARIAALGGRFAPEPGFADRPVSETTWAGAVAFCAWRGARLPTEAEWEATARGRGGRTYPWGETPPSPERAVYGRGRGDTDPVASHPAGATPEGVFHMAGNMAEWTSTLFRPYPYDATDGREDPGAIGERVTRGGDHVFDVAADRLTGFFRDGFSRNPLRGHRHIGFRCAKDAS